MINHIIIETKLKSDLTNVKINLGANTDFDYILFVISKVRVKISNV